MKNVETFFCVVFVFFFLSGENSIKCVVLFFLNTCVNFNFNGHEKFTI